MNGDKWLAALLFISFVSSDLAALICKFWPETGKIKYDLFLNETYNLSLKTEDKLTVSWYLFELLNNLEKLILVYVLAKISLKGVSYRLFKYLLVFTGGYVVQFLFYMWNRNTSYTNNICLYFVMAIGLLLLIKFEKKDECNVINMDS